MTGHPATLYGFVTGLVALIGVIVLMALGDIPSDVGLPILAGLGAGGVGVAGGVAIPTNNAANTGTVGMTDPNA